MLVSYRSTKIKKPIFHRENINFISKYQWQKNIFLGRGIKM